MMVTGCSSEKKGTAESAKNGEEYVKVEVSVSGDKITSINIDEFGASSMDGSKTGSKKELADAYGMKQYSPIGKEWYEQIQALEEYIVANGIDSVETDESGKAIATDLKTSCSISVEKYLTVAKEAVNNAK